MELLPTQRLCPSCGIVVTHTVKYSCDIAKRKGNLCDSCGRASRIKDLTGARFGKLVVVEKLSSVHGRVMWLCLCDCTNTKELPTSRLGFRKNGNPKVASCGCWQGVRKDGAITAVMSRYVYHAKKRGIPFRLSLEEFAHVISLPCYYCGELPSRGVGARAPGHPDFLYNGVDRVGNDEEYSISNTVPCCFNCNWMKMDSSVEEFLAHVKKVHKWGETNACI